MEYASVGYVHVIAAIVCAKWAMELGFSQFRQLLWAVAGLLAAPVVLLVLYARLVRKEEPGTTHSPRGGTAAAAGGRYQ